MVISREQLYEDVWREPVRNVAARYGVPPGVLAEICDRLKVPRPGQGYWSKVAHGKADPRPPLPESAPDHAVEWNTHEKPKHVPRPRPASLPKAQAAVAATGERPSHHPLILGARSNFKSTRETHGGYLRPTKLLVVDVFASKTALEHALDTTNAVYLALEERGHRVELAANDHGFQRPDADLREDPRKPEGWESNRWAPMRPTIAWVGSLAFGLSIYEMTEYVEVRTVRGTWVRVAESGGKRASPNGWSTFKNLPSGRIAISGTRGADR